MFTQAYLEQTGQNRLRHEEQLVQSECQRRGIAVVPYPAKRIHRRQLPLTPETFICGDMDAMHGAMKQMNIEVPTPNDYPECLMPWFGRSIWKSSVGAVEEGFYQGTRTEIFMKPAGRRKCFTGGVFSSAEDLYGLAHISRNETVWCSTLVSWLSEFRVYVLGDVILSVDHYSGDASFKPCSNAIQEAVKEYRCSGQAPAAYGIDFGVLDTGETALVEANDGYSLGAYAIDATSYTDLLFTRWRELIGRFSEPQLLI